MQFLNMQLNTPSHINRDLIVKVIDQVSGKEHTTTPYLDGTARLNNLAAGAYRLQVLHPNLVHAVVDRPIRVLPDQPTFVPIRIPTDIFSNTPIRDITDEDISPEQARLDQASDAATGQAKKVAGQPIFATDWNELALTVADVAKSTRDLSQKLSPIGHDHPEIVERLDEIQGNIQRFFDVFARTVAELQREMQKIALLKQINATLDEIPGTTQDQRRTMEGIVSKLDEVLHDDPLIYTKRFKRVGEELEAELEKLAIVDAPETAVLLFNETRAKTNEMSRTTPAKNYEGELVKLRNVDSLGGGGAVNWVFKGI